MQNQFNPNETKISTKSWLVTLLLVLFTCGLHRIYVGKVVSGIIYLFTAGGMGIGLLIDLYKIVTNTFTDKDGAYIVRQ